MCNMFYGICIVAAVLLSTVAIINSNAIEIAFAQTISDANTFDLTIDNQRYPLKYNITGGEVTSITADPAQATFLINIASREDGTLAIELPRNVIDSKSQGNTDEEYAVFVDDQPKDFEEISNNNEVRTLEIGFENGAEKIEIAGTQITAKGATSAPATEERSNATSGKTITASNTFDLTIDNQRYPLKYNITGGEVTSITADPAQATFLINIASREDGTLAIELPRNVIDSKSQGNTDEEYAVFVDDQPKDFEEISNNNEVRTLEIGFENGAEKIEIAGTRITAKGATGAAATEENNTTTITTQDNATTITTKGPIIINKNNATGAAATEERSNATGGRTITASNTFDLTIDNQRYPLKYNITGGEVTSITADPAQATFLINIAS